MNLLNKVYLLRLKGLGLKVNETEHEWFYVFARCISPTQKGICWSLSVTIQAWDNTEQFCITHSQVASPSRSCQ